MGWFVLVLVVRVGLTEKLTLGVREWAVQKPGVKVWMREQLVQES